MFDRRGLPARFVQLLCGLILYGIAVGMMVRADLGLDPWSVLAQGLATRIGLSFGMTSIVIGFAVLLIWVPLRERPGIGTVVNIVLIGLVSDATLAVLSAPSGYLARFGLLGAGILLNGVATGAYIGAKLGVGPRDGLMMGINRITGLPVKHVRMAIEVTVLTSGWLLGGTVGIGTAVYAVTIGLLVHYSLVTFTPPKPNTLRVPAEEKKLL